MRKNHSWNFTFYIRNICISSICSTCFIINTCVCNFSSLYLFLSFSMHYCSC